VHCETASSQCGVEVVYLKSVSYQGANPGHPVSVVGGMPP